MGHWSDVNADFAFEWDMMFDWYGDEDWDEEFEAVNMKMSLSTRVRHWTSADGRKTLVEHMTDTHLLNALAMIERGDKCGGKKLYWITRFNEELNRRNICFPQKQEELSQTDLERVTNLQAQLCQRATSRLQQLRMRSMRC